MSFGVNFVLSSQFYITFRIVLMPKSPSVTLCSAVDICGVFLMQFKEKEVHQEVVSVPELTLMGDIWRERERERDRKPPQTHSGQIKLLK